jgi:hypothetical protein
MGVNNGAKCLYSLKNLTIEHVVEIGKRMARVNGRVRTVILRQLAAKRKKSNCCSAVIGKLQTAGFDVTVVFDPPSRHHSKVASIDRAGKREKARLLAYSSRFEAKLLSEKLTNETTTTDERLDLETKLYELHSKAKTSENASISALISPTLWLI